MNPEDVMCHSTFDDADAAIAALRQWAELAQLSGRQLGDLLGLVSVESAKEGLAFVTSLAPRTYFASALDMVDDAELLGVLATPDEPDVLRIIGHTAGKEACWNGTLAELTRGRAEQIANDNRAMN